MACHSSLLGPWMAEVKAVLGDDSGPFELSSFIFDHFLLLDVGLGLNIKRAGVVKFLGPTFTFNFKKKKNLRIRYLFLKNIYIYS